METKMEIIQNPIYEKSLKKGHRLAIHNKNECDIVSVRNAEGLTLFTIEVSDQGASLNIEAENINLVAAKKLNLSAADINITSNKELHITSEGNLFQQVKGNKTIKTHGENFETAKSHHIKAFLGDVKLSANDDVKLNGERVKLNCD